MYSAVETKSEIKLYPSLTEAYRDNFASVGVNQLTMEEALQTGKDIYIYSEDKWILG